MSVLSPGTVDRMSTPGAKMSTHVPKLVNVADIFLYCIIYYTDKSINTYKRYIEIKHKLPAS